MSGPALKLIGSEYKGAKILVIDPDVERGQRHETDCENDLRLQRVDVYFVKSLEEARDGVKKYNCNLAIFPDGLSHFDFVNTQIELKHANPEIQMIVLSENPSLDQLRSSKKVGGVYDYSPPTVLESSNMICETIMNFLRDTQFNTSSQSQMLEFTSTIQKCFLIQNSEWPQIKLKSKELVDALVLDFDFSTNEVMRILAAEQIFLPWLTIEDYSKVLGTDRFNHLARDS